MSAQIMQKWSRALTSYSVDVQPGQTVAIQGGTASEPLLRSLYKEVVQRGGLPVMLPLLSGLNADLLKIGNDQQLEYITPVEKFVREKADVIIQIIAETNTRSLAGIDLSRQAHFQRARTDLFKTFMEREGANKVQWTLTLFPTDAHAQDAEMSTADYAEFVFRACKLHEDDPVAAWESLATEQQRLIDWLSGGKEIRLSGPDTDLTLSVEDRKWINADGRKNFPDGEIFTAPVEHSANGHITYSFPAVYAGQEVTGVRLQFENGKVVSASASKGEDLLLKQLDIDEGARYLGEFAIGTNFDIQDFTKQILFDEKIGGTVHLALGETYLETGGTNTSAIHWDMICDLRTGGRLEVDGKPFLVDGKIVV
ncbi:aminopeptidase [soil metagenome]